MRNTIEHVYFNNSQLHHKTHSYLYKSSFRKSDICQTRIRSKFSRLKSRCQWVRVYEVIEMCCIKKVGWLVWGFMKVNKKCWWVAATRQEREREVEREKREYVILAEARNAANGPRPAKIFTLFTSANCSLVSAQHCSFYLKIMPLAVNVDFVNTATTWRVSKNALIKNTAVKPGGEEKNIEWNPSGNIWAKDKVGSKELPPKDLSLKREEVVSLSIAPL